MRAGASRGFMLRSIQVRSLIPSKWLVATRYQCKCLPNFKVIVSRPLPGCRPLRLSSFKGMSRPLPHGWIEQSLLQSIRLENMETYVTWHKFRNSISHPEAFNIKLGGTPRDFGQPSWYAYFRKYVAAPFTEASVSTSTNRFPSWHVYGVRNDFLGLSFYWVSLPVVAFGFCESNLLEVPSRDSSCTLIVVLFKSCSQKYFSDFKSMRVRMNESCQAKGPTCRLRSKFSMQRSLSLPASTW